MSKRYETTAIIYDRRGNILSIGYSSFVKTHPLQAKYAKSVGEPKKIYLHAEVHAITKLPRNSKPYKIAVFRFGENNNPLNSKPCKICQHAINLAGIKHIEHT